jgi:hypothetical protein
LRIAALGHDPGTPKEFEKSRGQRFLLSLTEASHIDEHQRVVGPVRERHPPIPCFFARFDVGLLRQAASAPVTVESQRAAGGLLPGAGSATSTTARIGKEVGVKANDTTLRFHAKRPSAMAAIAGAQDRRLQDAHAERPRPLEQQPVELSAVDDQALLKRILA